MGCSRAGPSGRGSSSSSARAASGRSTARRGTTSSKRLHAHVGEPRAGRRGDLGASRTVGRLVPPGPHPPHRLQDPRPQRQAADAHELGPKDVVYVGENEKVRVIMRFQPPAGKYMMHCHNLVHEDHDMMGQFEVGSGRRRPDHLARRSAEPAALMSARRAGAARRCCALPRRRVGPPRLRGVALAGVVGVRRVLRRRRGRAGARSRRSSCAGPRRGCRLAGVAGNVRHRRMYVNSAATAGPPLGPHAHAMGEPAGAVDLLTLFAEAGGRRRPAGGARRDGRPAGWILNGLVAGAAVAWALRLSGHLA